jgi:hypothetical protein
VITGLGSRQIDLLKQLLRWGPLFCRYRPERMVMHSLVTRGLVEKTGHTEGSARMQHWKLTSQGRIAAKALAVKK